MPCSCPACTPAEDDVAPVAVHDAEDEQHKDEDDAETNGPAELGAKSRDEAEAGSRDEEDAMP